MADYRDFLGWRDGGLVFEKDGGGEELFPVLPGTLRRAAERAGDHWHLQRNGEVHRGERIPGHAREVEAGILAD